MFQIIPNEMTKRKKQILNRSNEQALGYFHNLINEKEGII